MSVYAKKFTRNKDVFEFNEKTKRLKKIDSVDIQKEIQSFADCALDKQLDRFGTFVSKNRPVVYGDQVSSDFSVDYESTPLNELHDLVYNAEKYRVDKGLSDSLTIVDIYKAMSEDSVKMKNDIINYQKSKEVVSDEETLKSQTE